MQNFLISFNVVFPIFLMMVLGFFLKKINIMSDATVKQVNNVIFRVFLPLMIFKNVYESDIDSVFDPKLILFAAISVIALVVVLFLVIPLIEKDNKKRGVLIQGLFRSNFVIFGLPVTEALCGSGVSGSASVLVAIIIPIFNFIAVITLESFGDKKGGIGKILKGIVTNPLIIASVIGLAVSFIGFKFPSVVEKSIGNVAGITTPLALIMLGASINFKAVKGNLRQILIGVLGRLVVVPAIFLALAVFVFKFRGNDLAILLTLFASPAAVSSFTMAQQMGGDDELAGHLVMFGTTACVVTVFLWIFLIVQMGWV